MVCKSSGCGFCQYEHANQLSSIQSIAGFLQFDGRDEVAKTSSFVSSPPCGGRVLRDGGRPGLLSLLASTYSVQVKLICIFLTFSLDKRKQNYFDFCKISLVIENALRYQGVGAQCSRVGDRGLTVGEQNEVQGKLLHFREKGSLTCE